jgi:ribose transport system permease protein
MKNLAFLGGRIGATSALVVCTAGFVVGVAILVLRHRRRAAFGLPGESPWLIWGRGVAIAIAYGLAMSIYREGMPVPVLIAALVTAIGALLLQSSRLGRYAFAIGGNAEAARLSGIPVVRVKMAVYLMAAVLTAVAALVAAARANDVTPGKMGLYRELDAVTAVVIGGTSLQGGRATMLGTLLGALIFGTLSNGMNLLTISSNWQLILTGLILLGASTLDSWSNRSEAA